MRGVSWQCREAVCPLHLSWALSAGQRLGQEARKSEMGMSAARAPWRASRLLPRLGRGIREVNSVMWGKKCSCVLTMRLLVTHGSSQAAWPLPPRPSAGVRLPTRSEEGKETVPPEPKPSSLLPGHFLGVLGFNHSPLGVGGGL